VAANAAGGFKVLECEECARQIKAALLAAGHSGQIVELRAKARRAFMVCLSYDGGRTTITQNGRHLGVRVGDVVFDNLHPAGLPFEQWLRDFDGIGGVEVYSTSAF
jgi:hypothetical protein